MYKAGFYASKVYRILCLSIPLVTVYGTIMVGAAGHSSDFTIRNWAAMVYCILTPALFYLYENIGERGSGIGVVLSYVVIGLVLTGLLIIAWNLLDALVISRWFFGESILFNTLILGIPMIVSLLVLFRLFQDQKPDNLQHD